MADASINMQSRGDKKRLVVGQTMLNSHLHFLIASLLAVLIYFGAGLAFYMTYEGYNFTTTMFFLVQTVTTVGYFYIYLYNVQINCFYIILVFILFFFLFFFVFILLLNFSFLFCRCQTFPPPIFLLLAIIFI